jgi:sn-glycerol 3-phosphate transport system substrate-binding protein
MTSMRRLPLRLLALGATLALTAAACGGGGDDDDGTAAPGPDADELPECPVAALDEASGPVDITVWHSMTRANEEALVALTNEFNDSQDKVQVKLVNQTSYNDTRTKYRAALGTGGLPDLVQMEDTALQFMIDTQSVLPAESCIEADDYDTADFVDRVISYYSVGDVLWPMPFNVSNPIFYFDRALFREAGLDPEQPPATLDEVRAAAEKIVQSGAAPYGIALRADGWLLEQWISKAGEPYVNNGNGRDARATEVTFGSEVGLEIFTWLREMVDDKLLLAVGSQEGSIEDFLAVGNGDAAMTIGTSAALGTISQVLGQGQFASVDLGVGALPGPEGESEGGVLVGGAAMYVTNGENTAPEKQAAAWEFAKFLADAQSQAEWSAATGYLPVRESATEMAPLTTRWQEAPFYRIAYDQLLEGAENVATAGPVMGPYGARGEGVRGAVLDALDRVLSQGAEPEAALQDAVDGANEALTEYNERIE